MNYEFLPEAEAEYLEAIRFYQDKQNRLGALLIDDFERVVNLIVQKPETWRMLHPSGIRRVGLSHFPYSVEGLAKLAEPSGIIGSNSQKRKMSLFKSDKVESSKTQKVSANEQVTRDFSTSMAEYPKLFIPLVV